MSTIKYDPASFRDPSGKVFSYEESLYRELDDKNISFVRSLLSFLSSQKGQKIQKKLVSSELIESSSLGDAFRGKSQFILKHQNSAFMEVITIQSQAFNEIVGKIEQINKRLSEKEKEPQEKWLDNQELMQLLKISKRTAQHYRDSGMISFSQVGNKIYYKLSDVEELLKKHYNKAFKR